LLEAAAVLALLTAACGWPAPVTIVCRAMVHDRATPNVRYTKHQAEIGLATNNCCLVMEPSIQAV